MPELNNIYLGDCIEVMKTWPENFVDTILTDPPYGIRFMGKAWDGADIEKMVNTKRRKNTLPPGGRHGLHPKLGRAFAAGTYDQSITANRAFQIWCTEWAAAALRIAKPGATMLVFGGTRTFHRMTSGLEDAGWQIRDCITWLYGSGFPKSHNLHDNFEGYGTALKPAWEPIIVAMKPLDGTFAQNAEKWGVAGLNIDGGRIATDRRNERQFDKEPGSGKTGSNKAVFKMGESQPRSDGWLEKGRWPANLILDEDAAAMLDGQSGVLTSGEHEGEKKNDVYGKWKARNINPFQSNSGGASRFFYVAKADRAERNEGCEEMPEKEAQAYRSIRSKRGNGYEESTKIQNNHPTVKPLSLMKYLCTLTKTPTGGIVLDPFAGSGTTLWAAECHNRPWIGIEQNSEYVKIAEARLARERAQIKMAI